MNYLHESLIIISKDCINYHLARNHKIGNNQTPMGYRIAYLNTSSCYNAYYCNVTMFCEENKDHNQTLQFHYILRCFHGYIKLDK